MFFVRCGGNSSFGVCDGDAGVAVRDTGMAAGDTVMLQCFWGQGNASWEWTKGARWSSWKLNVLFLYPLKSLESFGNSSGNSCTKFTILDIKFHFACGESNFHRNSKLPEYYGQDSRFFDVFRGYHSLLLPFSKRGSKIWKIIRKGREGIFWKLKGEGVIQKGDS